MKGRHLIVSSHHLLSCSQNNIYVIMYSIIVTVLYYMSLLLFMPVIPIALTQLWWLSVVD